MGGVDFVDGMDTEKAHLPGDAHSVHNVHSVHSVHYLDKSNWLKSPNLGLKVLSGAAEETRSFSSPHSEEILG